MCGRYSLAGVGEFDPADFGLPRFPPDFRARYNVAPSQAAPVVWNQEGVREAGMFRWGLVPHWAKDPKIGNRMINARAETADRKPAYRAALAKRRCLVPADGFYEWKKEGRTRTPYHFRLAAGRPFSFAGLWESWRRPEGGTLFSFTILTTSPNPLVAEVHDRMPVILERGAWDRWLEEAPLDPDEREAMLVPFPAGEMESWPVSTLVNSPANDLPQCIERVAQTPFELS